MSIPFPGAAADLAGGGNVGVGVGSGDDAPWPTGDPRADLACLVCRSRKVRCDKSLPSCRNCCRLGVPCPGYSAETESISRKEIQKSADDIFKAAGVEKRRVGSCAACRTSKHRCSRTRPSCRRCINRSIPCVYPGRPGQDRESPFDGGLGPSLLGQQTRGTSSMASPAMSEASGDLDLLSSETLPDDPDMRLRLVDAYFDRSNHLRCLSFLHQSTFLQSIERDSVAQDYGEPLLYIICALGARNMYLDAAVSSGLVMNTIPGTLWAEKARKDVLADIQTPTIQHLMTIVLLCDYEIRNDQNAQVFVLIAFLYRVIRLLSLDTTPINDSVVDTAAVLQRETEIRLVWACYFIDMFVGTGIEKNTCWQNYTPRIPLPVSSHSVISKMQSTPLFVPQVEEAGIVPYMHELGVSALTILVIRLRFKALRLIRTSPSEVGNLQDTSSPFLQIIHQIDAITSHIPEKYQLTEANIKYLKDHKLLGAVFFLHFIMLSVTFDLARISLPGFNFPLALAFSDIPAPFRQHFQEKCRYSADRASELLRMGMAHGREALDDPYCADVALECSKIQIIYAATVDHSPAKIQATKQNLDINLGFLEMFHIGKEGPSPHIRTVIPLCMVFGFGAVAEKYRAPFSTVEDIAEVTGSKDEEHLAAFAPFRRAKHQLRSRSSPHSLSSGMTQPSTVSQPSQQHSSTLMSSQHPGDTVLSTLQPGYQSFMPQHPAAAPVSMPVLDNTMPPSHHAQMLPPVGVPAVDAPLQTTVDQYLKTADQMASYMTWDVPDLQPWLNFDNLRPP